MSAALAYRWDGERTRLYCDTIADSYNDEKLIDFLKLLKFRIRSNAILIWDGLPAHRSRLMSEYLLTQSNWLHVERLPGYAPDLNPVELLWGNVKGTELANYCVDDLRQAESALQEGMSRVRRRPDIIRGFLHHTGVSF